MVQGTALAEPLVQESELDPKPHTQAKKEGVGSGNRTHLCYFLKNSSELVVHHTCVTFSNSV